MKYFALRVLPFLNNPKDLDLSYKTDLDFWDGFGKKKLCLITKEVGKCLKSAELYLYCISSNK